jgi:hypothetical protein
MPEPKAEFLKGAVDLLILKVVALGPIHGYAISQRIQQISKDFFKCDKGRSTPHCIGWRIAAGSALNGGLRIQAGRRSFTH